jgi:hypothetical protein
MGCAVGAAIAWVSTPFLAVCLNQTAVLGVALSSAVSLALFAGWGGLGKLERQFDESWGVPLRNLPEK